MTWRRSLQGEGQAAIRARALLALDLVWQGGGDRVLAVTHGGFGNSLLRELLGAAHAWFAFGAAAFATMPLSRTSQRALFTEVKLAPHLKEEER
ncbi:histidine phosphatase family protein [Deinococcus sp. HMF7604]|uniref:histidine phosphatase family protein n=1 Tax=Deinococcus betulae TaxID=2873312 RepID=UPI001CCE92F3|nr:histidine phosphatase family protein [Deinococcus betulae]MBZ9750080.1 histidine phosphatase family protein [Deinococcus betulae]